MDISETVYQIDRLTRKRNELKESLYGSGIDNSKPYVDSTPTDKVADRMSEVVDYDYQAEVYRLQMNRAFHKVGLQLGQQYYEMLYLHYIGIKKMNKLTEDVYYERLSFKSIAELLHVSTKTIGRWHKQAIEILRDIDC